MNTEPILQQLVNGLVLGSIYGLIAVGYSLVYGILGLINFAHGDIYMISAFLCAIAFAVCNVFFAQELWLCLIITFIFAVSITGLYGFALERIAYKPLRRAHRLAPLISAIGMSILLQNYVRLAQGADSKGMPALFDKTIQLNIADQTADISQIKIVILVTAALSLILLSLLMRYTRFGRNMRATQQDPFMARLLGINTEVIIPGVFVLGSMMAAVAGILVTFNYGSFDFYIGFITGMKAFTAAVLGGIGSLFGAMLGGLLLGLSESLFAGFVSSDYKDVFAFALLIIVLVFRPNGLIGKARVNKV